MRDNPSSSSVPSRDGTVQTRRKSPYASLGYLFALLRHHRPKAQDASLLRAARAFLHQRPTLPQAGARPVWLDAFLSLHDSMSSP